MSKTPVTVTKTVTITMDFACPKEERQLGQDKHLFLIQQCFYWFRNYMFEEVTVSITPTGLRLVATGTAKFASTRDENHVLSEGLKALTTRSWRGTKELQTCVFTEEFGEIVRIVDKV